MIGRPAHDGRFSCWILRAFASASTSRAVLELTVVLLYSAPFRSGRSERGTMAALATITL